MSDLSKKAVELFNQGYSCSESVVRAAYELNIINNKIDIEILTAMSSAFSGGMGGSGCLCGAVAGSQIVIGSVFGRNQLNQSSNNIKALSSQFVQKFKDKRKATCCRVLTAGLQAGSPERRNNCTGIVSDASSILEEMIKKSVLEDKINV
jgi:C_GCAxxG_C_C family probable redox protein